MNKQYNWPILGHSKLKNFFQTSIENQSLSHAYLFYGAKGVGKLALAKIFAQTILCQSENLSKPCGECQNCKQFVAGVYADLHYLNREINEKSGLRKANIQVAQVRNLQEKISTRAFLNSYKIVIIPEAETLSQGAGNSLLKTLEEPTARTIIIMLSDNLETILPTILSRVQKFKFLPVTKARIYDLLVKKGADRDMAREIAELSEGKPEQALTLWENQEQVGEYKEKVHEMLRVFSGNMNDKFSLAQKLTDKKSNDQILESLRIFMKLLRDILLIKSNALELTVNGYLKNDLRSVASNLTLARLVSALRAAEITKNYVIRNVNPRLALENLFIFI